MQGICVTPLWVLPKPMHGSLWNPSMGFEGDPCMGFFCMACMAFLEGNDGYLPKVCNYR